MKKRGGRNNKIVMAAILAIVAIVAIVIVVLIVQNNRTPEKKAEPSTSQSAESEGDQPAVEEQPSSPTTEDEPEEAIDPSSLGSIDIAPASLTVSYIKGVGGFEYEVLRLSEGRKNVEFRNSDLIGTKCEQDTGAFVSIVQSPNESEQATITKTTTVDGVTYGLSVASPTCTDKPELLKQYQEAFVKPFSLLKKRN